jgi:hypothetical protein
VGVGTGGCRQAGIIRKCPRSKSLDAIAFFSEENAAKFWLSLIELVWAVGYNSKELRQVGELVEENVGFFLEKGYEQPRNA